MEEYVNMAEQRLKGCFRDPAWAMKLAMKTWAGNRKLACKNMGNCPLFTPGGRGSWRYGHSPPKITSYNTHASPKYTFVDLIIATTIFFESQKPLIVLCMDPVLEEICHINPTCTRFPPHSHTVTMESKKTDGTKLFLCVGLCLNIYRAV